MKVRVKSLDELRSSCKEVDTINRLVFPSGVLFTADMREVCNEIVEVESMYTCPSTGFKSYYLADERVKDYTFTQEMVDEIN